MVNPAFKTATANCAIATFSYVQTRFGMDAVRADHGHETSGPNAVWLAVSPLSTNLCLHGVDNQLRGCGVSPGALSKMVNLLFLSPCGSGRRDPGRGWVRGLRVAALVGGPGGPTPGRSGGRRPRCSAA
jgi:hypothetical protein